MIIKYLLIYYLTNAIICKPINTNSTTNNKIYNFTSGVYEAIEIELSNKKLVHRLMSIPYAEAPHLFQKSNQLLNRTNPDDQIKTANHWPNMCIQTRIFNAEFYGNLRLPHKTYMSFDCLTINLYIPINNSKNSSVLLFVHGGSNAVGTSSYVDGTALAAYGDVIVATINFRLDVTGFFNMPNSNKYKGNYGLWDQLAAIKWLHSNCVNIGCNKDSITLFGHSAGSANVLFHALSSHARPYIKRIIMQSGSGLAHWATNYEQHLLETEYSNRSIKLFKKTRYANTVYDTLINIVSVTKCNQTMKYKCIKEKLNNFMELNANLDLTKLDLAISLSKSKSTRIDLLIMRSFWNLANTINLKDLIVMFGYIFKEKFKLISNSKYHFNETTDKIEHFFSNIIKISESNEEKIVVSPMKHFLKEKDNNQYNNTDQEDTCFVELQLLVENYQNTLEICYFLKEINVIETIGSSSIRQGDEFMKSKIMRYFLSCFTNYYIDKKSVLFELNDALILSELEQCTNTAIDVKNSSDLNEPKFNRTVEQDWNDYELFSEDDEDFRSSQDNSIYGGPKSTMIVKEIAWLSDNIKNLHRANIDNDYINGFPHLKLTQQQSKHIDIDVMIGITKHESFYFLEFNYNLDDVLKHAFVYSSLLNMTTDLIEKLTVLNTNKNVNMCLKKKLLKYYSIDDKNLWSNPNSLDKNHLSLNLINDFEFVLPMITHLKLQSDYTNSSSKKHKKFYAYQFNFKSSFNYMLTKSLPYSDVYKNVYNYLNGNVVPHFSELDYVLGLPILSRENLIKYKTESFNYNYTQNEYDLSILMMKYWSNFAKYGDPNHDSNYTNWSEFGSLNQNIFNISSNTPTPDTDLIELWLDKHNFWYKKLPNNEYDHCKDEFINDAFRIYSSYSIRLNLVFQGFFVVLINLLS